MKPITREEQYLNKLAGEEQTLPEPVTREEQYLSRLCGADNIIPQTPETRREAYLAALCGEEVETPEPETRIEQYMNFAAGKSQSKPEKAITREEMYWDKYQGGAVPEEKTVQGDIIHITDATGDNAVALSVALAPTQDLHGYDHPWPAGGGKNLADFVQDKGINNNGIIIDKEGRIATVEPIFIENGVNYVFKHFSSSQYTRGILAVFNGDNFVRRISNVTNNEQLDVSGGDRFYFCVYDNVTIDTAKAMVVKSTDIVTEYEPYSNICPINGFEGVTVHVSETQTGGTTYPVTFTSQGTVYGGTIDVVSGEMSITYAIADMGDLEWTQPSTGYFEAYFNAYNTGHEIFGLLTTSYPKDNGTNMIYYARITARGTNQRGIVVRDSRYNDITDFKTAVTGQKVAYELSTPITATIDPTTIELNEGENYVWTEEGTTTLTYMARAAQRVLAMNRILQTNLKSIELKKGGDVK